jgi:hypothetical protein
MRKISTPQANAGTKSLFIVANPGIACTANFVLFKCDLAVVSSSASSSLDFPTKNDELIDFYSVLSINFLLRSEK